jgi:pyruvate/2-oxoglutarate/acetoin dehydrogenase E1 component/TPP-dependent pyruvate/acetoin dehydrogenase alpha subunit
MTQMPDEIADALKKELSFNRFKDEVLADLRLSLISREVSLIGRREVLTGKAEFGIFGDGKELPQIAMAKVFQNGDFRSGYYRDQTFMLASGLATVEQLFAQLYANPTADDDPNSGGRQMNNHFATRSLDADGEWLALKNLKNSAADNSPTGSQMPRALGLALASKKYRALKDEIGATGFSNNGNEICFATIGDASTSEGLFWEAINAAGVLQVPLIVSVLDDGYGISVPKKYQTTKASISEVLSGFKYEDGKNGFRIYTAKAWDYVQLVNIYNQAAQETRVSHIPVIIHIEDATQPQGHSTSGSHERYKPDERLRFEKEYDCIVQFKKWITDLGIATPEEIKQIENEAKKYVAEQRKMAWKKYHQPIIDEKNEVIRLLEAATAPLPPEGHQKEMLENYIQELNDVIDIQRKDIFEAVYKTLILLRNEEDVAKQDLIKWKDEQWQINEKRYGSHQFTNSSKSPLKQPIIEAQYNEHSKALSAYQLLNVCFKENFERDKTILAFGEDVGKIGDVNQAFAGLQQQFGNNRVYDTGIREATIIGEGIGLAMRGWRPIAEIQYLDYLIYGLQPMTDDAACLSYRSKGGQKAPLIVRTRGHRLEGIWHAGSPMQMLLGSLRGMHLCVPRNMTQAAGFYNLLLRGDEPALVIECLNGYRLKEKIPSNVGTFTVPLGVPEILQAGTDITLVTYGSCVRIAQKAIEKLAALNISIELIDVQTLLPFDIQGIIGKSIKKTNRVVFLDEDYPGGATAYMMQKVMEEQHIFNYLDIAPQTITAKEHRTAFGTDGDYFSKPNEQDIFRILYNLMHESNPKKYRRFL